MRQSSHQNSWPTDTLLTVTTLNIGAAAIPRARLLLHWLRRRSSDVLVLTETSAGAGSQLIAEGLVESGYAVYWQSDPRDRGVMVASRRPVAEALDCSGVVTLPHRVGGIVLDMDPRIAVVGVYVPSRDRSEPKVARKRQFIASLLGAIDALGDQVRSSLMLVGDYNVVSRRHQPSLRGYFPFEYDMLDELERLGLRAAHELRPGKRFPYSWVGRTGAGYLYDYVHLGSSLHARLQRCTYLEHPRLKGLTDHAGVMVKCQMGSLVQAASVS